MSEKTILWADQEHMYAWESTIEFLNNNGFVITKLESTDSQAILNGCVNMRALVLHCGIINPMASMAPLLHQVKETYPGIAIGLETNTKHPTVEDLVEFYIYKPIRLSHLMVLLNSVIES